MLDLKPVALSLLLLVPSGALAKDAKGEAPLRRKAAEEIAKFAGWCVEKGAVTEARRALAEAKALDTESKVGEITVVGNSLRNAGEDTVDSKALEKKRKSSGKTIAKLLDKLAGLSPPKGEEARFSDYAAAALRW
ncbi:MAG: hypothetical protein ACYTG4_11290, partial [Planctomycetota bacterium]